MLPSHTGLPKDFVGLLMGYFAQISEAIRKNSHHDHRRALLIEFIRKAFGIEIDEIELELKVKAAEARGRIDAFYKFVIFELKVDMEKERADAVRELKKYFESRETPEDYIAVVTDGLRFEIYDYDPATRKPLPIRQFEINIDRPELVYRQLDELLTSGKKIPPSSDDIVGRFDLTSTSFSRSLRRLEEAFEAVAEDTAVSVKFREWNPLLARRHGYLVIDYRGIRHRPVRELAEHTDADGIWIRPLAMDRVVGNDIRAGGLHHEYWIEKVAA